MDCPSRNSSVPEHLLLRSSGGIPSLPGTYLLHMVMGVPAMVTVGCLGKFHLQPGNYLYIGSALGPGGLSSRIRHHQRISSQPIWHIVWFRPHACIRKVICLLSAERLECAICAHIASLEGVTVPIIGFGSSDCHNKCRAHFYYLSHLIDTGKVFRELPEIFPGKDFVIINNPKLLKY